MMGQSITAPVWFSTLQCSNLSVSICNSGLCIRSVRHGAASRPSVLSRPLPTGLALPRVRLHVKATARHGWCCNPIGSATAARTPNPARYDRLSGDSWGCASLSAWENGGGLRREQVGGLIVVLACPTYINVIRASQTTLTVAAIRPRGRVRPIAANKKKLWGSGAKWMAAAAQDGAPWLAAISAMNVAIPFTTVPTHSMSRQSRVCIGTSPRQRRAKNDGQ